MKPRANLKLVAEPRSVEDVLRMFLRDRDDAVRDIAGIDEQMLTYRNGSCARGSDGVIDRPFSPETLANRWGCSSEMVRQMCRRGDLSYFRLGKLIRIPANEVDRVECLTGDSSSTEDNGASPTGGLGFELRLERQSPIAGSRKLALVQSGGHSKSQPKNG